MTRPQIKIKINDVVPSQKVWMGPPEVFLNGDSDVSWLYSWQRFTSLMLES